MSHQVTWETGAIDQTARFLRDDPVGALEFVRILREHRELLSRVCFLEKADGLTTDTPPPRSLPDPPGM